MPVIIDLSVISDLTVVETTTFTSYEISSAGTLLLYPEKIRNKFIFTGNVVQVQYETISKILKNTRSGRLYLLGLDILGYSMKPYLFGHPEIK